MYITNMASAAKDGEELSENHVRPNDPYALGLGPCIAGEGSAGRGRSADQVSVTTLHPRGMGR
jgi:hypothetical protein